MAHGAGHERIGAEEQSRGFAHDEAHRIELPPASEGRRWRVVADTYREPPADVFEEGTEPLVADPLRVEVGPRSVVILTGKRG